MTRLIQELRADPDAVFEFGADLPSGNRMQGTVGPMLNGKVCMHITFAKNPASQQDIDYAKAAFDQMMGQPTTLSLTGGIGGSGENGTPIYGWRSGMTEDWAIQRAREITATGYSRSASMRATLHKRVAISLRTIARECAALADPPMGDATSQFNRGRLDAALAIREKFPVEEK